MGAEVSSELSGVLVVDKPAGPTSFDVVRRVRRAAGVKKVGHTGTLDPMATGVLVLCLGRATKLTPFLQEGPKEYAARLILGLSTETDDVTGRVTAKQTGVNIGRSAVLEAAAEFQGDIEQVAPSYSAIKINGQPAHRLARRGDRVPPRARQVTVYEMKVTEIDLPYVSFYARVSKGTYIRSLAADLGRRLRTGACLDRLRRLSSGPFTLKESLTLEEAETLARAGRLTDRLVSPGRSLSFLPAVNVTGSLARMAFQGRPLPLDGLEDFEPRPGPIRIESPDRGLVAVYEYIPSDGTPGSGRLTPLRVLGRE